MAIMLINGDRPYWLQYVFDGKSYQCSVRHTSISKSGGTVNILFRVGQYLTGSTTPRLAHIINRIHQVESGGNYDVKIYEAPTITDVGTQIVYEATNANGSFSNLNRQTDIKLDSICEVYYDCTFTGGAMYAYEFIQSGGQKGDIGEYSTGEVERVMKPNTDYVIQITNNSTTADGVGHSSITWYESGE